MLRSPCTVHRTLRDCTRCYDFSVDQAAVTAEAPVTEGDGAERAARGVFLAGEAVALVFYVVISRPMWFYLDEWDFLANRTAWNVGDLFRAHNEHWVTLPVLAYRGLWWI